MEGRNSILIKSEDNMETIIATGTKDICTYISLLAIIVSFHKQSRYWSNIATHDKYCL